MIKTLAPGERYGEVRIPSSKSVVHRLLICAALGGNEVTIRYDGLSRDIRATADCLNALGPLPGHQGDGGLSERAGGGRSNRRKRPLRQTDRRAKRRQNGTPSQR